jgi:hypothetical protein
LPEPLGPRMPTHAPDGISIEMPSITHLPGDGRRTTRPPGSGDAGRRRSEDQRPVATRMPMDAVRPERRESKDLLVLTIEQVRDPARHLETTRQPVRAPERHDGEARVLKHRVNRSSAPCPRLLPRRLPSRRGACAIDPSRSRANPADSAAAPAARTTLYGDGAAVSRPFVSQHLGVQKSPAAADAEALNGTSGHADFEPARARVRDCCLCGIPACRESRPVRRRSDRRSGC